MKKSKLALLLGTLLSLFVLAGCPSPAGTPENPPEPQPETEYVTVTFDATEKGYYVYKDEQTKTVRVEKGAVCTENFIPKLQDTTTNYYEFAKSYCKKGTTEVFDFSTPITEDITLLAQYNLKAAEIRNFSNILDGTKIEFEPYHSSKWLTIKDFNYEITVKDLTENKVVYTDEGDIKDLPSKVEVTELTHGNKYSISIETIYKNDRSLPVQKEAYPLKEVSFLMMMYMDGDNNLNDPIFLDLNEAEYGLSKLSEENQAKVAVLALWDGWTGDEKTSVIYGTAGTKLLELGADDDENNMTALSAKTKDWSSKAEWLSSVEVDMSDKQTLVNFLNFVNSLYYVKSQSLDPNCTILQFSNHGRRAMCWDETSGGETFLKTSDISAALEEAGYSNDNKLGMIIEDVCLGGSIEEAYELKNYTSLFLASPNNVPGKGMDYTTLIEAVNTNVLNKEYSKYIKDVGSAVCNKYTKDYAVSAETWEKVVEDTLNKMLENEEFKTQYNALSSSEKDNFKNSIKKQLSINASDLSTISLISTSYFSWVNFYINKVVTEILNNGNAYCKNFSYDAEKNEINQTAPVSGSNTNMPIPRSLVLQDSCLRPYDAINYQGTFTWLYDLGYLVDHMAYIASVEEWQDLYKALNDLAGELNNMMLFAWRDGCDYPTYSTEYGKTPYKYGWLGGAGSDASNKYLHYGLTISGETIKYTVNGDKINIINGDYPSWYTELKFGQDCKWNDLLNAWFGK